MVNLRRFYCKHCKNKQAHNICKHKETVKNVVKYIDLIGKKLSLREISKEMEINLKTAFLWRHKILNALTSIKQEKLSGIVEADETYFRESER